MKCFLLIKIHISKGCNSPLADMDFLICFLALIDSGKERNYFSVISDAGATHSQK